MGGSWQIAYSWPLAGWVHEQCGVDLFWTWKRSSLSWWVEVFALRLVKFFLGYNLQEWYLSLSWVLSCILAVGIARTGLVWSLCFSCLVWLNKKWVLQTICGI
jgi:hypothetical protein